MPSPHLVNNREEAWPAEARSPAGGRGDAAASRGPQAARGVSWGPSAVPTRLLELWFSAWTYDLYSMLHTFPLTEVSVIRFSFATVLTSKPSATVSQSLQEPLLSHGHHHPIALPLTETGRVSSPRRAAHTREPILSTRSGWGGRVRGKSLGKRDLSSGR